MVDRVTQPHVGASYKTRNQEISEELVNLLTAVGNELDVYFDVYSGGQVADRDPSKKDKPGGWTGSTRHDHGNAADVDMYRIVDGKKQPIRWDDGGAGEQLWREAVRLSVAGGATGIGAGLNYMGGGRVHIGYGKKATWNQKGESTPEWLREAYVAGGRTPPLGMPTDPPNPRVMSAALQELTRGAQVPQFGYAPPMGRMSAEFGTNLPSAPNPRPRSWIDAIRQPSPASMSASLQQQTGRQPYPPLPAPAPLSFPSLTSNSPAPPSMVRPEGPATGLGPGGPRLPTVPGLRDALSQVPSTGYGADAPMGNNRMGQMGVGALLDPRSFSPSTPNPPLPVPGLASGGTTPRQAALMPRPQQAAPAPQTMIAGRPSAPVGSMPAARPAGLSAPGAGLSPSQQLAMLAMPRPASAGAIRTANPIAGSNAQPLPGRPPSLGSPRDDIGMMPNYSDLSGMATNRAAPTPATMSAALAALRNQQPARAPVPATMSAQLSALRSQVAPRPAPVSAMQTARQSLNAPGVNRMAAGNAGSLAIPGAGNALAPRPAPRPQQIIRAGQHQYVLTPNGYQFADQGGFNGTGGGGSLV